MLIVYGWWRGIWDRKNRLAAKINKNFWEYGLRGVEAVYIFLCSSVKNGRDESVASFVYLPAPIAWRKGVGSRCSITNHFRRMYHRNLFLVVSCLRRPTEQAKDEILVKRFSDERQLLVKTMFKHSNTKKIWTTIDVKGLLKNYRVDRARVVKALEYFDGKGWIELRAAQAVDLYGILSKNFDVQGLGDELMEVFLQKEAREIERIHQMVRFFESETCISQNLSRYFGEDVADRCGHCSV